MKKLFLTMGHIETLRNMDGATPPPNNVQYAPLHETNSRGDGTLQNYRQAPPPSSIPQLSQPSYTSSLGMRDNAMLMPSSGSGSGSGSSWSYSSPQTQQSSWDTQFSQHSVIPQRQPDAPRRVRTQNSHSTQNEETENAQPQQSQQQPQQHTEEEETPNCPDMLVKRGMKYFLYISSQKEEEGKNPVVFNNLDEYQMYLDKEEAEGRNCPILFVQQENDVQGKDIYRVRESPFPSKQQGGLPNQLGQTYQQRAKYNDASRLNPPFNKGNYAGFDPYGLYVGRLTEVDDIAMKSEKEQVSDNPMDPNWGGVLFTQKAVDAGKYKGNEITKPRYYTPKTQFLPILNSNMPKPPDPLDM